MSKYNMPIVYKVQIEFLPIDIQEALKKVYENPLLQLFTVGERLDFVKSGNIFTIEKVKISEYLKKIDFKNKDEVIWI